MRALLCLAALTAGCLKSRPPADEKVEPTSTRVERGAYLSNAVFGCIACHSDVDDTIFGAPLKAGAAAGAGGQCWGEVNGFPGHLCAPNLTADGETGLGKWTDGEIMRAIREGIDREGNGLFPLMPYREYASLSDEDTRAIVAYLRTLPKTSRPVAAKELDFPVGIFIRLVPRPLEGPVAEPDHGDRVAYGRYLAMGCVHCHSPVDGRGRRLEGRELSGGQQFKLTATTSVSSVNLTPDVTGLGTWTEERFIARFHGYQATPVQGGHQTVMPWPSFASLTDDDLAAIFAFLRTTNAVENRVTPWP